MKKIIYTILLLLVSISIAFPQLKTLHNFSGTGSVKLKDNTEIFGKIEYDFHLNVVIINNIADNSTQIIPPFKTKRIILNTDSIGILYLIPLDVMELKLHKYEKFEYFDVLSIGHISMIRKFVSMNRKPNRSNDNSYYKFKTYLIINDNFHQIDVNWNFKKHILPLMKDKKEEMINFYKEKEIEKNFNNEGQFNKLKYLLLLVNKYNSLKDPLYYDGSFLPDKL